MPLLKNKKFNKFLSIWLLVLISMVIFIIFIGGLTRLTDSGLSITEWQVFSGILYPITDDQWNYYFQLYKEIPQYNLINNLMSINDFKFIFFLGIFSSYAWSFNWNYVYYSVYLFNLRSSS